MPTKTFIFFILFIFISTGIYAQIKFEPGYIIDNSGKRTICLIKNLDWRFNPTEFEYRLAEDEPIMRAYLYNTSEFSIGTAQKYVRAKVRLEISSNSLKELSFNKTERLVEKTVFLKTLLQGKASLYEYKQKNIVNYLFRIDTAAIETLIHKKYYNQERRLTENVKFKNQLWRWMKCDDASLKEIRLLEYKKKDLLSFFRNYNRCKNASYTDINKPNARDWFNFSLKAGLGSSQANLEIQQSVNGINEDFDNQLSPRLGFEAEFLFPFSKNKWSFFVQPMYQSYAANKILSLPTQGVNIDYKSIETTLGIRHYSFLTDTSKLFFNAGIIVDSPINSGIFFEIRSDLEIETQSAFNLGLGYTFKNKYSIEANYTASRQLITNFARISSRYTNFSLILGYRIF